MNAFTYIAGIGRGPSIRALLTCLGYVVTFVVLDWISFIEPFGPFSITAWNPCAGFSLAFALLVPGSYMPLLAIAPLLTTLIFEVTPAPLVVHVLLALVVGSIYGAAVLVLRRAATRFDPSLTQLRDIVILICVAIASSSCVAGIYVAVLVAFSLIEPGDFWTGVLRYWVGDVIGILVVTPLLLAWRHTRHQLSLRLELLFQLACAAIAVWVIFASAAQPRIDLFYLLFLPIIWMGLRGGLAGVNLGLAATQLLIVIAIQRQTTDEIGFTAIQAMMLVLALTGLAIGVVVDERRRAEMRLRSLQDLQAQLARQGSFNELSAALAHEINQPLSAATTYARIAVETLEQADAPTITARETAHKAMLQVQRAAEVVRRMRQLIRAGRGETTAVPVSALIRDAIELAGPDWSTQGIEIEVRILPPDLRIMADALQVQQVLINLLRNAVEAMDANAAGDRRIFVQASRAESGSVAFIVEDTGPGFRAEQLERPFEPFATTKIDGLGIGLNLCRTIIQANGGRLWIANSLRGAAVRFTLPEVGEVPG